MGNCTTVLGNQSAPSVPGLAVVPSGPSPTSGGGAGAAPSKAGDRKGIRVKDGVEYYPDSDEEEDYGSGGYGRLVTHMKVDVGLDLCRARSLAQFIECFPPSPSQPGVPVTSVPRVLYTGIIVDYDRAHRSQWIKHGESSVYETTLVRRKKRIKCWSPSPYTDLVMHWPRPNQYFVRMACVVPHQFAGGGILRPDEVGSVIRAIDEFSLSKRPDRPTPDYRMTAGLYHAGGGARIDEILDPNLNAYSSPDGTQLWIPTEFHVTSAVGVAPNAVVRVHFDGDIHGLYPSSYPGGGAVLHHDGSYGSPDDHMFRALSTVLERMWPQFELVVDTPMRDRPLQVIVRVQRYEIPIGGFFQGRIHQDGLPCENIIASGIFYPSISSELVGGELGLYPTIKHNTDYSYGYNTVLVGLDSTMPVPCRTGDSIVFRNRDLWHEMLIAHYPDPRSAPTPIDWNSESRTYQRGWQAAEQTAIAISNAAQAAERAAVAGDAEGEAAAKAMLGGFGFGNSLPEWLNAVDAGDRMGSATHHARLKLAAGAYVADVTARENAKTAAPVPAIAVPLPPPLPLVVPGQAVDWKEMRRAASTYRAYRPEASDQRPSNRLPQPAAFIERSLIAFFLVDPNNPIPHSTRTMPHRSRVVPLILPHVSHIPALAEMIGAYGFPLRTVSEAMADRLVLRAQRTATGLTNGFKWAHNVD